MPVRDHFRAFARQPVHLSATIELMDGTWQQAALVKDLGLGGARLEMPEPVAPGTPVRLRVSAPHLWDPLELKAHIAWAHEAHANVKARVGLRFDHASSRTLRRLLDLFATENYD
jgi:hypothetical protein